MSSRQSQNGGDHSNIIQSGGDVSLTEHIVNNNGLSYSEAKDLFMMLFRDNFFEMRGQAMETVAQRAEEVTVKFLTKMQERAPDGFSSANDPAVQRALVTAQTEYACSGSKELGDVLVDILVDRAESTAGSLEAIVLSEALTAAPKLTSGQISALTVSLAMRHTDFYGWNKPETVYQVLESAIFDAARALGSENVSYAHMSYVGVGSSNISEWNPFATFPVMYPGAFTHGFHADEIHADIKEFEKVFIPAWRDSTRLQCIFGTEKSLTNSIPSTNALFPHLDTFRLMMKQNVMTAEEVEQDLREHVPSLHHVFDAWKSSGLKSFDLSSVGYAIGQANWRRHWKEAPQLKIYLE